MKKVVAKEKKKKKKLKSNKIRRELSTTRFDIDIDETCVFSPYAITKFWEQMTRKIIRISI